MEVEKAGAALRSYLDVFGVMSAAESEKKLRACASSDLLRHIEQFQDKFPGASFRVNWLRQQHDQALAEWTQLNGDGSEFITAHSYARVDESGLIVQFSGFWEPF